MILVFIILSILTICMMIMFLILSSTLRINIEKFDNDMLKKNFLIYIEIYLFNKIKVYSYKIDNSNVDIIKEKNKIRKRKKKGKRNIKIEIKDAPIIFKLNPKINKLKMNIEIGTENVILTSYIVAIMGSTVSFILPYVSKKHIKEKYKYNICPNYKDGNIFKFNINCIFEIKMVHIINVIYLLKKRKEMRLNERTTSNRRPYGYRYE